MNSLTFTALIFFTSIIFNQEFRMASEIVAEFPNLIRVFENGTVQRFHKTDFVPPSDHPQHRVMSKDIKVPPKYIVSARLYKPNHTNQKLPLLIYIHGGGFCTGSAFSSSMHSYLNNLVAEANLIAASIEYRLAPEHPIPACYDDAFSALEWIVSASDEEPWLRDNADFSRIFLAGESAGANIAHNTMVRASDKGVKIVGMALVHPHFAGSKMHRHEKLWLFFCKRNSGLHDPRLNPAVHPNVLKNLICDKILVCTAEKDFLRDRGWTYYEALKKSKWPGRVEIYDSKGEDHAFHLNNQTCANAIALMQRIATFFKE